MQKMVSFLAVPSVGRLLTVAIISAVKFVIQDPVEAVI